MLSKIFPATKGKILGSNYRLFRQNGWTSNGYWLMLSVFEPRYMSELKSTTDTPPNLQKPLEEIKTESLQKLKMQPFIDIAKGIPLVKFESENEERKIFIYANVYFVSLFEKSNQFFTYWGTGEHDGIVVKKKDEIVGLIMPVRY